MFRRLVIAVITAWAAILETVADAIVATLPPPAADSPRLRVVAPGRLCLRLLMGVTASVSASAWRRQVSGGPAARPSWGPDQSQAAGVIANRAAGQFFRARRRPTLTQVTHRSQSQPAPIDFTSDNTPSSWVR